MSTTDGKWSELPPELLTSIGKLLDTRIEVLQFRSVCSSWRSALPSGTWPPPLPLTFPFPIVPHSFPHPPGHYTLTEATVYRLHSPSDSPPNTWILKVSENLPQGKMRLLNPLSRDEITPLPQYCPQVLDLSLFRISEILRWCSLRVTYDDFDNRVDWEQENQEMINTVQKAVFFDNLTAVVIHNNGDLAGLRLGDERWTLIEYGRKGYSDLINFKGKIYAVNDWGDCLVIDSMLNVREFSSPWNYLSGNKLHLLESCGELWLLAEIDRRAQFSNLQCIHMHSPHRFWFKACKLKEVEDEWVEVLDLGDRILFASKDRCSFSVSAADFKACNCKGNCIFFLTDSCSDASVALWDEEYYGSYTVGTDDKVPQIYRVGDHCVDLLAAHPGLAHLFRPLSSLLASDSALCRRLKFQKFIKSSMAVSSSTTIPPALAYLVSNFNSLVNIKLDSGNYVLWKTKVLNALRANGYIEFLDGSIACPPSTVVDSENNSVVNPDFTLWTLIDSQLLSCLTASLSSATLPHVLGLTHVSQVWYSLEHRFNSQSRSHIHELKGRFYSGSTSGSMESCIDEVRSHAQRLESVGYHVEDDVLKSEKMQIQKDEYGSAKVFVEASKLGDPGSISSSTFPNNQNLSEENNSAGSGQFQQSHAQMFQPMTSSGQFYPQFYPTSNRNIYGDGSFNKGKGGRGSSYGGIERVSCQICGKNNHTAFYCLHRQNLQYQPFSFMGPGRSFHQQWNGHQGGGFPTQHYQVGYNTFPSSQNGYGPMMGYNGMPYQQWNGHQGGGFRTQHYQVGYNTFPISQNGYGPMMGYNGMPGFSGHVNHHGASGSQQFGFSQSSQYPITSSFVQYTPSVANMVSHSSVQGFRGSGSTSGLPVANNVTTTPNWYFDSGALTHVTNDLASLQLHQPCHFGQHVVVGNGTSIPVTFFW